MSTKIAYRDFYIKNKGIYEDIIRFYNHSHCFYTVI